MRVAAAVPEVAVANVRANVARVAESIREAAAAGCDLVAFPELCLTGYTCGDLFHQRLLQTEALEGLKSLAVATAEQPGIYVVGLPLAVAGRLYNAAAVLHAGKILGIVPKSYLPNYKEYYERRWFFPGSSDAPSGVEIGNVVVPFGTDLLFEVADLPQLVVGIEICEDLWVPIPCSSFQALAGATLLVNLSASIESTAKGDYRRELVVNQSARCIAGYIYAASGVHESTTDFVFGGHAIIAENGQVLAEGKRFGRSGTLLPADVDVELLTGDRLRMGTYADNAARDARPFRRIPLQLGPSRRTGLLRTIAAHPFVPRDPGRLAERCEEIFATQTSGLAKRIEIARPESLNIGVSGGLDSTLALLVAVRTCDLLGKPRSLVRGLTMPGFGTSQRTLQNAERLMQLLGIQGQSVDIRKICLDAFAALGHQPFGIDPAGLSIEELQGRLGQLPPERRCDLVFENVQARMRTLLLMNRGFVVGTGDLSELALGWCTYNGDHMAMYNPNASIPKTLVRFLVRWAAEHEFTGDARTVLLSIADTVISPELLPVEPNGDIQSTEQTIGPYELHDFFLYHVLRFGTRPRKILYLAEHATFDHKYSPDDRRRWLEVFLRRFFTSQFKRSCLPDGPKVGSASLSPRGDWRMPSDAEVQLWLEDLR